MRDVACPVLIRAGDLLVFRHPLAGVQLVKGGIKDGETPQVAALRELQEEAGVTATSTTATPSITIQKAERWWLCPVTATNLPDHWTHHCADDGGHDFAFFWHPLTRPLQDADPRFERTRHIIETLTAPRHQG